MAHEAPISGVGCLSGVVRLEGDAVQPCACCYSELGTTYIAFRLEGENLLRVVNIKSASGSGWGMAMVRVLRDLYPERTDWVATSINKEALGFWSKVESRLGIGLRIESDPTQPSVERS